MTGGVVCSYCLAASKTKPEARREGEESILVADNGTFSISQMRETKLAWAMPWRENVCIYTNVFGKPNEQRPSLLELCHGENFRSSESRTLSVLNCYAECRRKSSSIKRTFKNNWELFEWRTGKGYLECERSSGIEAMGRRLNLQINVRTGIMEHCDVNT